MARQPVLRRDLSLPRSIAIWGDEFQKIKLPEEPFDPAGQWTQLYSQYSLGPFHREWRVAFRVIGALRLERTPGEGGAFRQKGRRVTQMISKTWLATDWTAHYAGDRLATPQSWSFTSDLLFNFKPVDADFRYPDIGAAGYIDRPLPMASAKHAFSGRLKKDSVANDGMAAIPVQSAALAGNWGLFDAVQRLTPALDAPLAFDMLEDFDLYKPAHTLRPGGSLTVTFAGGPVRLHSFQQLGRGILPWEYWLTDEGRLVLAVGGYRGYVLNPDEPIGGMM